MGWMESQVDVRERLDAEMAERAYAELASAVSGPGAGPAFYTDELEQADGAVRACLRSIGVEPGVVPDDITELEDRIEWLCRPSGTMHRTVRLEEGWYKNAFGTMLGKVDDNPVVLLPTGFAGYSYVEPGSGRKVRIDASNEDRVAPEAVFFYRPLPTKRLTIRDLLAFIGTTFDASDYALVILAALVVTLVGLLPAQVNKIAFGTVVPGGQTSLVAPMAALLLGVAVSTVLFNVIRNLIMTRVSLKLQVYAEAATFSRILMLPASFFKSYASGNLAVRVTQMSSLVQQLTTFLLGVGLSSVMSLVYLFQISSFAGPLVLPALLVTVCQAAFTIIATVLTARYERETMDANAKVSGTVTALLNGIQKIKLAGAEDRAFAKWARGYSAYARATYNRPVLLRALPAIVGLVSMVGGIAIFYVAGSSHINIANYMAFNVAYGQISVAIMQLAGMAGQIVQIGPMLEMLQPILEAEPEIDTDKPSVDRLTGGIEVSGVSFRYEESQPYVLKDLSFKIKPGEYVAFVGKSGCGKSTIMRLLLGFEKAERGSIFYGPYDVTKVDLRSLRRSIGTVMQDGKLFMGDLASNITISTPDATLDDAWEAAEIAGIADDIRRMPMGMQTLVTEGGGGISGGQRQRIMIARAVCGKRRILMLDEATSALDNVTQKHVADSLEQLKCTRVVVAHRLSTVRHCDRILVVDGGRIAEEGSYEELIAKGGLFAELVARQRLEGEA